MQAPEAAPSTQVEKFRDLACELERDEDEGAFDEKLKRVAKASKPPSEKPG